MTSEVLESRLQAFAREIGAWCNTRAGRTPTEFAQWFWAKADKIVSEAGPRLEDLAQERISDLVDSALDAGLFGRDGEEDVPFPR